MQLFVGEACLGSNLSISEGMGRLLAPQKSHNYRLMAEAQKHNENRQQIHFFTGEAYLASICSISGSSAAAPTLLVPQISQISVIFTGVWEKS